MKQYRIRPLTKPLPTLAGAEFDPETEAFCKAADCARIDSYVWDAEGYAPEAGGYVAWDAEGLHVLLCAREREICAVAKSFGDDVYRDSCLEFFLQPFEDDPRYLNIETNAHGVALIGFSDMRGDDRPRLKEMPKGMNIRASKHCGNWWAVAYTIPMNWIAELYGKAPQPGARMRGNFFKCDESIHPHFGSWNPIAYPTPNFHVPERFGELWLEQMCMA
jgi:hypothetical protein